MTLKCHFWKCWAVVLSSAYHSEPLYDLFVQNLLTDISITGVSRLPHLPICIGSLNSTIRMKTCGSPLWIKLSCFRIPSGFCGLIHALGQLKMGFLKANSPLTGYCLYEEGQLPCTWLWGLLLPIMYPLDDSCHSNPSCPHSLSTNTCSVLGRLNTHLPPLW